MVNLSLNFWNLSGTAWSMTYLPAAFSNLSTSYWIDNARLTQNINTLTSVSTVAYNAWNGFVANSNMWNSVSLMNLSSTVWNVSQQLANLSQSYFNVSTLNLSTKAWNVS